MRGETKSGNGEIRQEKSGESHGVPARDWDRCGRGGRAQGNRGRGGCREFNDATAWRGGLVVDVGSGRMGKGRRSVMKACEWEGNRDGSSRVKSGRRSSGEWRFGCQPGIQVGGGQSAHGHKRWRRGKRGERENSKGEGGAFPMVGQKGGGQR